MGRSEGRAATGRNFWAGAPAPSTGLWFYGGLVCCLLLLRINPMGSCLIITRQLFGWIFSIDLFLLDESITCKRQPNTPFTSIKKPFTTGLPSIKKTFSLYCTNCPRISSITNYLGSVVSLSVCTLACSFCLFWHVIVN